MKRNYKKKTVTRPHQSGCLCEPDAFPEGISHDCSLFTQLRPVTADHLKWRAGNGGKQVFKTGKWLGFDGITGRVRHVEIESGKLVAEIEHGDYWPTNMEEWVECYQDHKLSSVLLPSLDAASSLDFAEPWKGKGVGLHTGVKSNGLFCIVAHSEEGAHILQHYLPPTQRIHGRSGSPKRYFWYMKDSVRPTTAFKDAYGNVLVEIRGEDCMTPVPPTVHASGEPLRWQTQFPVKNPVCWPFESFEESIQTSIACMVVSQAWPEDDSGSAWVSSLVDCLLAAGLSKEFVAHFVASAALVPEDVWHEVYAAVLEHAAQFSKDDIFRWDVELANLLGKQSANLLADWLNLTPTDAAAESDRNQNETGNEEDLDLEFLAEGYHYCQGEPLECSTIDPDFSPDPT